jgi:hypothetical protein
MSHFGALGLLMSQSGVYEIRQNSSVSRFTNDDLDTIEFYSAPGCVTSDDVATIASLLRGRLTPADLAELAKLLLA